MNLSSVFLLWTRKFNTIFDRYQISFLTGIRQVFYKKKPNFELLDIEPKEKTTKRATSTKTAKSTLTKLRQTTNLDDNKDNKTEKYPSILRVRGLYLLHQDTTRKNLTGEQNKLKERKEDKRV